MSHCCQDNRHLIDCISLATVELKLSNNHNKLKENRTKKCSLQDLVTFVMTKRQTDYPISVEILATKWIIVYPLGKKETRTVWDTAGQERFQSIAENYYRNAHAAIICFDLSNISTLSNVTTWATRIIAGNKGNKIPLIFLVGTKMDCLTDSVVQFVETEAIKVATSLSAEYWSVSSQSGYNVENFFKRVAALSFSEIILNTIERIKEEKETQAVQYSANFVKLSKKKNFALIKACMVTKCVYKK